MLIFYPELRTKFRLNFQHIELGLTARKQALVDNIDASLIRRYKADEVSRVLESWRAMAAGHVHEAKPPGFEADEAMLRQQANSYVDGLPVQLFYEDPAASYAWAHALEEQAQVVRDEFLSVVNSDALESASSLSAKWIHPKARGAAHPSRRNKARASLRRAAPLTRCSCAREW